MGKKKKRKATHPKRIDPTEEQNRVREAVLKVFRARVSSPGGGPAIMLPAQQPEKSMSDLQLISIPNRQSSEDEMIIVDKVCMTSIEKNATAQKTTLQKEKKKKSKGERNKEKEIRKHTEKSKLGKTCSSQGYSTITQSRLTRKLGLYNQGKKSDRVLREPLPVNERILERTEKDLRKILDTSNELDDIEPAPHWSTPRSAACDSNMGSMHYSCHSNKSQPRSDSRSSCISSINKRQENVSEDMKTPTMPQTPDLNNVAEQLCSSVDLCMFPGRDLFSEIQLELVRTLRINSKTTPSKSTPAIRQQARNSQSARRSLQPLIARSAEQLPLNNTSHPSLSVSTINDAVMMDSSDRVQALFRSSKQTLNVSNHNQRRHRSHIPCTKSRPDDEPPFKLFMDETVQHGSGTYSEHGIHKQIKTSNSFLSGTILDFAENSHFQDKLATDFSLNAMDMTRKFEKAIMTSQEPMTTHMPYSSSLDFLDEMDRGPLHNSTIPIPRFDHQSRSEATKSVFSEDNFSCPNQDPSSPHTLPHFTTHTEDLFYEPRIMPEMMSPINDNIHYYPEIKQARCHKRRCRHASDSDESPVLCYKCLNPITVSSMGKSYSPKFHPQRMY
ncbi:uncharacterized protein LOC117105293 isoform X2 [Anneissia japonica]|uniref:uncharacterized protein LOC117105293 isoform X2 n=1 Tax=Anneissia japonica TaxID=1529436 RepID=UPI001425A77B|nr:uncharacterized protein LOC117105293 isoform X2 [Anneissia japonica]